MEDKSLLGSAFSKVPVQNWWSAAEKSEKVMTFDTKVELQEYAGLNPEMDYQE